MVRWTAGAMAFAFVGVASNITFQNTALWRGVLAAVRWELKRYGSAKVPYIGPLGARGETAVSPISDCSEQEIYPVHAAELARVLSSVGSRPQRFVAF